MTKHGCVALATSKTRIHAEPAFVVHRYDWSESSLILETFTRHHGRVALVAKGAKRPSSNFRPVLLPLQPLAISYSGDAEIRTLKVAEWVGGHIMPMGEALLSGYYINELLLRLLARDDPHPRLFDLYAQVVQVLAAGHDGTIAPALRAFELLLLRDIGLLPNLDLQTLTLAPLQANTAYSLLPRVVCVVLPRMRATVLMHRFGKHCKAAWKIHRPWLPPCVYVQNYQQTNAIPCKRNYALWCTTIAGFTPCVRAK